MEIIYKCDVCGSTSHNRKEIEKCERSHYMTPDKFMQEIDEVLGRDNGDSSTIAKMSGIHMYEIKIVRRGVLIFKQNLDIVHFDNDKLAQLKRHILQTDRLFNKRLLGPAGEETTYDTESLTLLRDIMLLNDNKKFTIQIGVE